MNLSGLTAKELDGYLAKALRTGDKALGSRVMREYRRRGIVIPQKLYRWALGTMPEQIPPP